MARIRLDEEAVQKADEEFYRRHPERLNRPLTSGPEDAALRAEWLAIYRRHAGPGAVRERQNIRSAPVCDVNGNTKGVYVYLYVAAAGGHGHVGLVLEQSNGAFIRYSQAAEDPNLQGWDRYEYLTWMQKVVVRQRAFPRGTRPRDFARGSKMVRIPTMYINSIQKAVDEYIADDSAYHLITNNCADFVNDSINAAEDVDVSDRSVPAQYYSELVKTFPGCVVVE